MMASKRVELITEEGTQPCRLRPLGQVWVPWRELWMKSGAQAKPLLIDRKSVV